MRPNDVLTLFSLALSLSDGPDLATFEAMLKQAGYPYVAPAKAGQVGSIEYAGLKIDVSINGFIRPRAPGYNGVGDVRFSMEMGVKEEASDAHSPLVFWWDPPESLTKTSFVSHLGKTVTIQRAIIVDDSLTSRVLKAKLDDFWDEVRVFAKSHGGTLASVPRGDWAKQKFPDQTILERADPVSIQRLVDSWGWRYTGGFGSSGRPRWVVPVQIGEKRLWINPAGQDNVFAEDRFSIVPFGMNREGEVIQLGKGMRIDALKRRIEQIAKDDSAPN